MSRMFNPLHPGETLREEWMSSSPWLLTQGLSPPGSGKVRFRDAHDALDDEFAALLRF